MLAHPQKRSELISPDNLYHDVKVIPCAVAHVGELTCFFL